jgi:hypothetical protein
MRRLLGGSLAGLVIGAAMIAWVGVSAPVDASQSSAMTCGNSAADSVSLMPSDNGGTWSSGSPNDPCIGAPRGC